MYRHAHQIILAAAQKHPSTCHVTDSSDNSGCTTSGKTASHHQQLSPNLVKYLNCAILINPDVATFWNCRRRLFQKNRLDIRREFQFSAIVLSKKPKSNDAFFYRRWLYSFQSHESIDWTRELGLCERCASKSLSNYHAWCHRQWVLQKAPFLLQYELTTTERFIRKHIGDYSGYHHRQFVVRKMNEFCYFKHEPNADSDSKYTALINFLSEIGFADIEINDSLDACNTLMEIIVPQRDCNGADDNDKIKIKSFLYCMNVAAYDLKFMAEMKELFGYREAFECHRKATVKFIVDKCNEWINGNIDVEVTTVPFTNEQPLKKMMKTIVNSDSNNSSANCKTNGLIVALKHTERQNGNELHRKWCEIFLGFH